MRRFLTRDELKPGSQVRLSPEETKHALRVLRLDVGSALLLTNGRGAEAEGKIREADPEGALVDVLSVKEATTSARLEVLQAPLKGPKMDWLVEKLTELGVAHIHLVRTARTVAAGEKVDRWVRLTEAAVKQSGNLRAPEIHPVLPLAETTSSFSDALKLLLQPGSPDPLAKKVREGRDQGRQRIVLAIGPEGGFTAEEEDFLRGQGFQPCSLSNQVLRGETAAIAAVAIAAHSLDF